MQNNKKIKVAICGYGNLGRGVIKALSNPINQDMELVKIFTRRNPSTIQSLVDVEVVSTNDMDLYTDDIDVVILCGGSKSDLPVQGPEFAKFYNTVDSFDTHDDIPSYLETMDTISKEAGKISIISVGWDPGLFSIARSYGEAILPSGSTYTFWGKGVSQGHSDAIRRISGVKNAIQYTIPIESAVNSLRNGEAPNLCTREKHLRECFVVPEDGADLSAIEKQIKTMKSYFADYDTTVHFISEEELEHNHSKMPHGGMVFRSGTTSEGTKQIVEYSLKLDSNPEFTGSILVAYARAAYRMNVLSSESGSKTVLDICPALLSPKERKQLIKDIT